MAATIPVVDLALFEKSEASVAARELDQILL